MLNIYEVLFEGLWLGEQVILKVKNEKEARKIAHDTIDNDEDLPDPMKEIIKNGR